MSNAETIGMKKTIETKKHLHVINVLKVFAEITIITKYILDLNINLTVGKFLASALAVEKQPTKIILKNKAT